MSKHIRFDWAMKRLLKQKANFEILEGFLSVLLKEDVTITEILESESNKDQESSKFNRVDILVKNEADQLFLIEVQNEREHDYFHRMNFGQAKLVTEHISSGDSYEKIKRIYSINIVYFDLGQGKDYVYVGGTNFTGMHQEDLLELNEAQKTNYKLEKVSEIFTTYYLLKVNLFDDHAHDLLDEWIYFLKNSEIPDNFSAKGLSEAKERLRVDDLSEAEKEKYDTFIKEQRIRENELKTAQAEGRQLALEEFEPLIEEVRREKELAMLLAANERRQKEEALAKEQEERRQKEEALAKEQEERRQKEEALAKEQEERRQKEEALAKEQEERRQKEEALAKEQALKATLLLTAKFMKESMMSVESIAAITGLSVSEIESL
jgi:predicted transposase/invertase (TIGR01784 family)